MEYSENQKVIDMSGKMYYPLEIPGTYVVFVESQCEHVENLHSLSLQRKLHPNKDIQLFQRVGPGTPVKGSMSKPVMKPADIVSMSRLGFCFGEKISSGSYSTVYKVQYARGSLHTTLACKVINKQQTPADFLAKFLPRELNILKMLDHPHVIQVYSILQRGSRIFIFMTHVAGGDLLEHVRQHGPIPELQSRRWFRHLSAGLHYLHALDIAHRDIKCENLLLSACGNLKIADFGFSRSCVDRPFSRTFCGSAAYAAPELILNQRYDPKLADVWSCGVVLFIMLNASMPFDDSNLRAMLRVQQERRCKWRTKVKETVSQEAQQLVADILEPDLTRRPGLDRLRAYPWVSKRVVKWCYQPHESVNAAPCNEP